MACTKAQGTVFAADHDGLLHAGCSMLGGVEVGAKS